MQNENNKKIKKHVTSSNSIELTKYNKVFKRRNLNSNSYNNNSNFNNTKSDDGITVFLLYIMYIKFLNKIIIFILIIFIILFI